MKGHPKGLLVLAITNMGERFGYYTMLAILALYIQAKFGLSSAVTSMIYGIFSGAVYFLPLLGGLIADKVMGYGRTVLLGIITMFAGYTLLALPSEANVTGQIMMYGALFLIAAGTGLFKGNVQALVGKLYDTEPYRNEKAKRDIAFSVFYMFINIGAFFAPNVANTINNAILQKENFTYDASIPNNYGKLNDFKGLKILDADREAAFKAGVYAAAEQNAKLETGKDSIKALSKAKRKEKVAFKSEEINCLFNLKAAGLAQLTAAGLIKDPSSQITKQDYQLLESRRTGDKAAIAALKERINNIKITDPALYGDATDADKFPVTFAKSYVDNSLNKSYNLAFGVACLSLIMSVLVFRLFRKTWKHVDRTHKQEIEDAKKTGSKDVVILSKEQIRERVIALFLVFFVVIFFWMSFHQNGLCMTFFARDYTASEISPAHNMAFSLLTLILLIVTIYGIYLATVGLFESKKKVTPGILISLAGLGGILAIYLTDVREATAAIKITPQIFQQFNPFFIVLLTPLSVALFKYLADKKREPSAPRKIGYGMVIAALGFIILFIASIGLPAPSEIEGGVSDTLVSPNWLLGTYFMLTIAELCLSPMGLSFVSKVAPPQYQGMMQGCWLAATSIGNIMVGIMGTFWDKLSLYAFWGVLVICCLLSAAFIFSIMKRLEKATN
jgi:POT family proton-dependent oligopeptide transporter